MVSQEAAIANDPLLIHCIGCRALVPKLSDFYGPEHSYVGTSPGCWQVYNELTAQAFSTPGYAQAHTLAANTYLVQHPGVPSRQSIQSLAIHLIGLYWEIDRGYPSDKAVAEMQRAHSNQFVWLEPPASFGPLTVVDIIQAQDATAHVALVHEWAQTTWESWQAHHPTIRRWAGGV